MRNRESVIAESQNIRRDIRSLNDVIWDYCAVITEKDFNTIIDSLAHIDNHAEIIENMLGDKNGI